MERRRRSARQSSRQVGTRLQVLSTRSARRVAEGRSKGDAPEIDGAVYVASRRPLRVGEIATVKIDRADASRTHRGGLRSDTARRRQADRSARRGLWAAWPATEGLSRPRPLSSAESSDGVSSWLQGRKNVDPCQKWIEPRRFRPARASFLKISLEIPLPLKNTGTGYYGLKLGRVSQRSSMNGAVAADASASRYARSRALYYPAATRSPELY